MPYTFPRKPPRVQLRGSRFRVSGLGFRVWGLGFRVSGLGFQVWGLGFRGFGFRVSGFGLQKSGCATDRFLDAVDWSAVSPALVTSPPRYKTRPVYSTAPGLDTTRNYKGAYYGTRLFVQVRHDLSLSGLLVTTLPVYGGSRPNVRVTRKN